MFSAKHFIFHFYKNVGFTGKFGFFMFSMFSAKHCARKKLFSAKHRVNL